MLKTINIFKNFLTIVALLSTLVLSFAAVDTLAFNSYFLNLKSVPIIKNYFKSRSVSDCQFKANNMENNIKERDTQYLELANNILVLRENVLKKYQNLDQITFDNRMKKFDELTNIFDKNLETMFDSGTQALAMKEDNNCDLKKFNELYGKYISKTPNTCYDLTYNFGNTWFFLDDGTYLSILNNSLNQCKIN